MMRGAVRVPVDDPRDLGRAERRLDGALLDIHDRFGLGGGARPALAPHHRRDASAQPVGEREKGTLILRIADKTPVALVVEVGGAQLVAVQQGVGVPAGR
jgi:hypothetical protein